MVAYEEGERAMMEHDLRAWQVHETKGGLKSHRYGSADRSVWVLAGQLKPNIVLVDDRALRGWLTVSGHTVMGTLGVLSLAADRRVIERHQAVRLLDELVDRHRLWIDVSTYQKVRKYLSKNSLR